jgi:hypothetical protein
MENVIIEKGKEQLQKMKMWADELEVQIALGKAEAKDAFERERKNIMRFVNTQKAEIEKVNKISSEKKKELISLVNKLEESLNLPIPTGKKKYDEYKSSVLESIFKVEYALKEDYGDEDAPMRKELEEFKTKMDGFRINLALNDQKDPEKVKEYKLALQEKVSEIRAKFHEGENELSKMDNFLEDISESFTYFKRAIKDIVD